MSEPLLCIMGPTASGKTELAIALAEALDGELISVDSALVYRGLDIGSAKPSYPHHLIDICDPEETYSAARFASDARRIIGDVRARNRLPILVGGTMLYFRALLQGLAPMPAADPKLREALEARASTEGWPALHDELRRLDPESAARIHPRHSQRLLRALEVCLLSDQTLSQLHAQTPAPPWRAHCVALAPAARAVLHERIALRLDRMLERGFLDEVRTLHRRPGLHAKLPALRSVGYRQLWAHLDGEYDLATARTKALAATRQLAKRQFTWLRKWPDLSWILTDPGGAAVLSKDAPGIDGNIPSGKRGNPSDLVLNYLRTDAM
ncbi:MAG: tRNA (adenosine(37)-N6)-dimethylallyltransferase MiaA [Pseudomonadota bacterium]